TANMDSEDAFSLAVLLHGVLSNVVQKSPIRELQVDVLSILRVIQAVLFRYDVAFKGISVSREREAAIWRFTVSNAPKSFFPRNVLRKFLRIGRRIEFGLNRKQCLRR